MILPFIAWLGVLQSLTPRLESISQLDLAIRMVGAATVLGSLTVMIYRLGLWRQQMENTRNNVGAAVRAHRDESAQYFARFERRLDAIDHAITIASEQRVKAVRWQTRTDRRLDRLESRVSSVIDNDAPPSGEAQ